MEDIRMMQNQPNPFHDQTSIPIWLGRQQEQQAEIRITDIMGRTVKNILLTLSPGQNQYPLVNDNNLKGMYTYTLLINQQAVQTRKLVVL